jgi:hypothetical protein
MKRNSWSLTPLESFAIWLILLWIIYIALVVLTEKFIQLLTPIIVPLLPEILV